MTAERKYTAAEQRALAPYVPAVPESYEEFSKENIKRLSVLDRIEHLIPKGWHDAEFRTELTSINGVDSVTGSAKFDKAFAARTIKEIAKAEGDTVIMSLKEAEIARKLGWFLRRNKQTPAQRIAKYEQLHVDTTTAEDENPA